MRRRDLRKLPPCGRSWRRRLLRLAAAADRTAAEARGRNLAVTAAITVVSGHAVIDLRHHTDLPVMRFLLAANLLCLAVAVSRIAARGIRPGTAVRLLLPVSGEGRDTGTALIVEAARMSRCGGEEQHEDRYWPQGVFGPERQRPRGPEAAAAAERLLQRLERQGVDVEETLRKVERLTGTGDPACCAGHRAGRLDLPAGILQDIDETALKAIGAVGRAEDRMLRRSVSIHEGSDQLRALLADMAAQGRSRQQMVARLAENWQQDLEALRRTCEELAV